MASELKVDKITGVTTAGSIDVTGEGNSTTTNLQQGLAKAWANFTGSGTVEDSLNTSSITNNSTGNNTQNYTNSFSNAFYSYSGFVSYVRRYLCGTSADGTGDNHLSGSTRTVVYTDSGSVSSSDTSTSSHGDLA